MAVKFRHKETGLFWCRAKGRAPSRNEDDVNDVLKLIRGNNLLETDEWKGDVNE